MPPRPIGPEPKSTSKPEVKDPRDADPHEFPLEGRPVEGNHGTPTAQQEARNQENAQATGNTADKTAENEDLLNTLEKDMTQPEREGNTTGDNPKVLKTSPNALQNEALVKRANELVDKYGFKPLGDWPNAGKTLKQDGYKMQAVDIKKLIKDDPSGKDWGIVDLRNPNEVDKDAYNNKIPGATAFPLADGLTPIHIALSRANQEVKEVKDAWTAELAKPDSPFRALQQKPIAIFHCMSSVNRTPAIASGYIFAVASRTGQKVIILDGGYEGYEKSKLQTEPVSQGQRETLSIQMATEVQWAQDWLVAQKNANQNQNPP